MTAYYNEFDPYAAQWLRNLIAAGHIAPGDVDERSIVDVQADDLKGYTQCHFFAGIGGWSLAARIAGWPDDRPLWTGSCPCQPFSVAGKGEGQADERHLWPVFAELIRARRPAVVMGEQVAVAAGAKPTEQFSFQRAFERMAQEQPGAFQGYRQSEQVGQPGVEYDFGREEAGEAEKLALRFGRASGRADRTDQSRHMRDDGPAVQREGRREGLGHPVSGSDYSIGWLHDLERQGDPVRLERDDADVGNGNSALHSRCDEGEAGGAGGEPPGPLHEGSGAPSARDWLDGVCADLQELGYACGAAIVPGCAVDAPHRRDRLWFVADAGCSSDERGGRSAEAHGPLGADEGQAQQREWCRPDNRDGGASSRGSVMANSNRLSSGQEHQDAGWGLDGSATREVPRFACAGNGAMGNADSDGTGSQSRNVGEMSELPQGQWAEFRPSLSRRTGHWSGAEWLTGADGKARRFEPSIRLLAHGVPARVGKLRAYGNAIVPQVAAEIIGAYLDACQ